MGRKSQEYNWQPEIIPQDDVSNFLIQSEADPSTYYRVDLLAYNGEGRCTCDDYCTRIEPHRSRQIEPVHKCCKHVRMAYEFLGREIMRKLSMSKRKVDPTRFRVVERSQVQGERK